MVILENTQEEKIITDVILDTRVTFLVYKEVDPFLLVTPSISQIPPELLGGTSTYGAA